jgi:hypothetical protein
LAAIKNYEPNFVLKIFWKTILITSDPSSIF